MDYKTIRHISIAMAVLDSRYALVRNGHFEIDDDGQRNEIFPCEFCPS